MSNHFLVLSILAENPNVRQRDIAGSVGITEGAVQRILQDLVESGHVEVERIGRCNRYGLNVEAPMRHPRLGDVQVQSLLGALAACPSPSPAAA